MSNGFFHTYRSARPFRKSSVDLYPVRGEAVLVDRRRGKSLALNTTARAVWERIDGAATVEDLCDQLAQAYDAAPDVVQDGVCAVLMDLSARKLLRIQPSPARTSDSVTRFVTFLNHHVEVYIDAPDFAVAFAESMGETFGTGEGVGVGRLEVRSHGDGFQVRSDGGSEKTIEEFYEAITWARRRANWLLIRARPDLLWFHAGAAAQPDGAMLCAGDYGSGKSTLVTSLYRAGWTYFTDDVLPYDPATGCVLPYPHTPSYRQGGHAVLPLDELSTLPRKRVRLEAARIATGPTPLRLIAFPAYQPDDPKPPRERSPSSTVVKLAKHCFNVDTYRADPFLALCTLADLVPAYDIEYNDQAPAHEQVAEMWTEIHPVPPG